MTLPVSRLHVDSATRENIRRELAHFSAAPVQFFQAWKRGVELAGPQFFGREPRADLDRAATKWDLVPKMTLIEKAIGAMSGGEKVFIAALTSFYNSEDGGRLLRRVGVNGFADLHNLDLQRRTVIADLLLNYSGW